MRRTNPQYTRELNSSCLKVLGAILELASAQKPISYRSIRRRLGWLSLGNYIGQVIERLVECGLIRFAGTSNSIWPT